MSSRPLDWLILGTWQELEVGLEGVVWVAHVESVAGWDSIVLKNCDSELPQPRAGLSDRQSTELTGFRTFDEVRLTILRALRHDRSAGRLIVKSNSKPGNEGPS